MRILVDANLSPRVAATLQKAGYEACHVFDVGLGTAEDSEIVVWATRHYHVIVSSDSDFGTILATQLLAAPSFVLLRHLNDLTPDQQADLLLANLPHVEDDLAAGAVVTLLRDRMRIRPLPFHAR
ncbi:Predicted nuclease, contains PIN domain, potential toxin-antitoxin system component [Parafrankia irregularis]|uniref:Predicted nuclease, contains PIN domain, potential toxin-antitoxin system component n=1 Tax=Parafrankia irregularis TaxID=795642 RepID=A0A0S4QKJ4_9ACTN|nr:MULTISPECIES: DUF5615 family PIN-like protein [Parafrankia]MBE3202343.1 DUF5615 family PIN-like protein [Parafrankia sp. CH37]CUU56097.1 Predicted nuclease, contains PIN domain, potential toxin-antitoxin system component [Parafrankia irregularis]